MRRSLFIFAAAFAVALLYTEAAYCEDKPDAVKASGDASADSVKKENTAVKAGSTDGVKEKKAEAAPKAKKKVSKTAAKKLNDGKKTAKSADKTKKAETRPAAKEGDKSAPNAPTVAGQKTLASVQDASAYKDKNIEVSTANEAAHSSQPPEPLAKPDVEPSDAAPEAVTHKKTAADKDKTGLGEITVSAATMQADRKKKEVLFKGDVVAEEDFRLCADELLIRYGDNNEVSEMTATGQVRIVQPEKKAAGDMAVYDKKKKAVIITGNAVALRCADTVRGERITFYLDSEDVLVEGGKAGGSAGGRVQAVIDPKKKCAEMKDSEEFKCAAPR